MTLDTLMDRVTSNVADQALVIELANTWMEKTGGRVTADVTYDAHEYISFLRQIPLWEEVRHELSLYIPILKQACIRRRNPRGARARMLQYAPTLVEVINHVMDHDFYSEGEPSTPLARSYDLLS